MKYLFQLLAFQLFILSCSNDKVEISKEEYNKLKGIVEVVPEYPKIIIFGNDAFNNNKCEIILASDSCEYIKEQTHIYSIFLHYPQCKHCSKKL